MLKSLCSFLRQFIRGRKGFDGDFEAWEASRGRDLYNTRNLKINANDNQLVAA